jgi:hypothetical protein
MLRLVSGACSFDNTPGETASRPRTSYGLTDSKAAPPTDDWTIGSGAVGVDPPPQAPAMCVPECKHRECGSDGCNGSCGSCRHAELCDQTMGRCTAKPSCDQGGQPCACTRDCAGRVCGDDGCGGSCGMCPMDAMCGSDGKCPSPVCGNGILESGEECDGGDGCGDDCKRVLTPSDLTRCLAFSATDAEDQCQQCVCNKCTQLAVDCYSSGDDQRDVGCRRLAECGNRHGCYDFSCYCGESVLCLSPNGECRRETELAVGSTDVNSILKCYDAPDCSTYRARTLGECLVRQCSDVCGSHP